MKYTDYTPNRTTRTIKEDMALIQACKNRSERNRKRRRKTFNIEVAGKALSALCWAGSAACIIYLGITIFKANQ